MVEKRPIRAGLESQRITPGRRIEDVDGGKDSVDVEATATVVGVDVGDSIPAVPE